jgi:hypothetical protein
MTVPNLRPLPNYYSLEPRGRQRFAGVDLGTLRTDRLRQFAVALAILIRNP